MRLSGDSFGSSFMVCIGAIAAFLLVMAAIDGQFQATDEDVLRGVAAVAGCLGVFVLSVVFNRFMDKDKVRTYRPFEQKALKTGYLDLKDLLSYHQQYRWADYAAVTVGMALLAVTFLVSTDVSANVKNYPLLLSMGLMTTAAIVLVFADIVHTNTQTPIIPLGHRFRLIDMSVRFGTLGAVMTLLAVLVMVSIINLWITLAGCTVFVGVLIHATAIRRFDRKDFFDYLGFHGADEWPKEEDYELDIISEMTNTAKGTRRERKAATNARDFYPSASFVTTRMYRRLLRSEEFRADDEAAKRIRALLDISRRQHLGLVLELDDDEVRRKWLKKELAESPPHDDSDPDVPRRSLHRLLEDVAACFDVPLADTGAEDPAGPARDLISDDEDEDR